MGSLPHSPAFTPRLSLHAACRELIAAGRAYRDGTATLEVWRDHVHLTLAHYQGRLSPGAFAEGRASGSPRRRAA